MGHCDEQLPMDPMVRGGSQLSPTWIQAPGGLGWLWSLLKHPLRTSSVPQLLDAYPALGLETILGDAAPPGTMGSH